LASSSVTWHAAKSVVRANAAARARRSARKVRDLTKIYSGALLVRLVQAKASLLEVLVVRVGADVTGNHLVAVPVSVVKKVARGAALSAEARVEVQAKSGKMSLGALAAALVARLVDQKKNLAGAAEAARVRLVQREMKTL